MPNSPGGQSCPALSLTSLPAPLSPVRYMSVCSQGCISGTDNSSFLTYVWIWAFAFVKHSSKRYFTITVDSTAHSMIDFIVTNRLCTLFPSNVN